MKELDEVARKTSQKELEVHRGYVKNIEDVKSFCALFGGICEKDPWIASKFECDKIGNK